MARVGAPPTGPVRAGLMYRMTSPEPRRLWLHRGLLAAAIVALFATTLGFGFAWDDHLYILNNPAVWSAAPGDLIAVFDPRPALAGQHIEYFPLRDLLYAILFGLFGPWGAPFHALNLALHLAATLALYEVLRRIARPSTGPEPETDAGAAWAAFAGALLFAVHPLKVESVAWISGLKDPLHSLFLFLAIAAYLRWRRGGEGSRRALALAVLAQLAAQLCKAPAVVLPALLLVLDLAQRRSGGLRAYVLDKIPFALVSLAALALAIPIGSANRVLVPPPGGTAASGFFTMTWVALRYTLSLAAPVDLCPRHFVQPATSVTDPRFIVALLILLLLLGAALLSLWRRRRVFLCLGWYLLCLLPYLNIVPIPGERSDRYLYLASVGPLLLLGELWAGPLTRLSRRLAPVALSAAVLALMAMSLVEIPAWRDDVTLWSRVSVCAPEYDRAWLNLGSALARAGRREEAKSALENGRQREPGYPKYGYDLAVLLAADGEIARATALLDETIAGSPRYAPALVGRARLHIAANELDRAAELLERARQAAEQHSRADAAPVHGRLVRRTAAELLLARGRAAEAEAELRALIAGPGGRDPTTHQMLAQALERQGRAEEAAAARARAAELSGR